MSRRINTKLIIIMAICIGIAVLVAGATWHLVVRASAAADIREANAAMESGNYLDATLLYAKALRHREHTDNINLILKSADAHSKVEVTTQRDATTHLKHRFDRIRLAVRLNPLHGTALQDYMNLIMQLNRIDHLNNGWDWLYRECDKILETYPDMLIAMKYRGISQVNRMSLALANVTNEKRSQAAEDLRTTLKSMPDDSESAEPLARWHVIEASVLDRPGGDTKKMLALREEAVKITSKALDRHSQNIQRLIDHTMVLVSLDMRDEAQELLDRLARLLLETTALPQTTIDVANLMIKFHIGKHPKTIDQIDPEIFQGTIEIVANAAKRHPDHMALRVALGRLHMYLRNPDVAMNLFETVWRTAPRDTPLNFITVRSAKIMSGIFYLDLKINALLKLETPDEREKGLNEIEQQLAEIKGEVGEVPLVSELAGRISSARGQWVKASMELDPINDQTGGTNIRTLLQAAESRAKMGEWGAAIENYQRVLELRPNMTSVRYLLAKMCLRGQLLNKAKEQIAALLAADPNNNDTRALILEWLVRLKRFDDADKLHQELDISDRAELCVVLARLYDRADQTTKGLTLLRSAFRKTPEKLNLLSWLVHLTDSQSEKIDYIKQCREAGGQSALLVRMEQYVKGELSLGTDLAMHNQDPAPLNDPVSLMCKRWRAHLSKGDRQSAEDELAALEVDESQYFVAIWLLFKEALTAKDWPTAELLTTRAVSARNGQGVDLAKGLFYLGMLNLIRGQNEQAIGNLRSALEQRKIFSNGWQLLAQALMKVQDIDAAIDAYETAIKQKPDHVDALLGLASARNARGDTNTALELLRKAHQYQESNYQAANLYAQYELRHGKSELALALRHKLAKENPKNVHNRRALALTLKEMNRGPEAARVLNKLIKETGNTIPNAIAATQILTEGVGAQTAAQALMNHVTSKGDKATVEDYLAAARQLLVMGQKAQAFKAYRHAIDIEEPRRGNATRALAAQLISEPGGAAEAVTLYHKLWQSDPSNLPVTYAYISALLITNALDKAESILNQVVSANETNVQTLVLSAQLAALRGQREAAIDQIDLAIKTAPGRANLLFEKARLIVSDPLRQFEALDILDRTLELRPSFVNAHQLKAQIYIARGELETGIREYEKLHRMRPRMTDAAIELANLYGRTGQTGPLKTLLKEMEKYYPQNVTWPMQLASLASSKNDLESAAIYLQRAFELVQSPTVLMQLVSLQLKSEKPYDALQTLKTYETIVKTNPVIQAMSARAMVMTKRHEEAMEVCAGALRQAQSLPMFVATRDQIVLAIGSRLTAKLIVNELGEDGPTWVQVGLADLEYRHSIPTAALVRLAPLEPTIFERPIAEQIYFYQVYSIVLQLSSQYENAVASYRKLLALQPTNWAAMHNLAHALLTHLNEPDQAIELAEQSLRLRPNEPRILGTLGRAFYGSSQYNKSREVLEASLKLQRSASVSLHLAKTLLKLGEHTRALKLLKSVKQLAEERQDTEMLQEITNLLELLKAKSEK